MQPRPVVTIRRATVADAPTLADLERRSPLVLGERELTFDRGGDYFAATRLMGRATVLLAEADGVPAGVIGGAPHRAVIGGLPRRLLYVHHARVPPEFQRLGVGRKLSLSLIYRYRRRVDSEYWFIAPQNAKSLSFAAAAANRWQAAPMTVSLDCARLAGLPAGRVARRADAARCAAIMNACHAREEMYLPYTPASFRTRIERDRGLYGWANVLLGERALVGAWPEGLHVAAETMAAGVRTVNRGASVLDGGFLPGGEDEFRALLGASCARFAAMGLATLSLSTSPGSPTWPLLRELGEPRPILLWTPRLPEPPSAAINGVYLDRVYL